MEPPSLTQTAIIKAQQALLFSRLVCYVVVCLSFQRVKASKYKYRHKLQISMFTLLIVTICKRKFLIPYRQVKKETSQTSTFNSIFSSGKTQKYHLWGPYGRLSISNKLPRLLSSKQTKTKNTFRHLLATGKSLMFKQNRNRTEQKFYLKILVYIYIIRQNI